MNTTTTHHCPHCVQRPLEACSYAGREVDVCPRCGGLWCEYAQWDSSVLGTYPKIRVPLTGSDTQPAAVEAPRRPDRACPVCRRPLTAIRVGGTEACELDQCDQCGGVWFDHGEWDHLASLQTIEAHYQDLDRPTTWGQWWFQFVMQLPVEFNVPVRRRPVGDNVEDSLGRWRYTLLYLGSAAASDLLHVVVFPDSNVPLVGASGAVFGVMAAYLLLYPNARLTMIFLFKQFKVRFSVWMTLFLVLQVVGALGALSGQSDGIAYWGHIGGFLAGVLFVLPQRRALIRNHPLLRLLHRYQAPA